MNQVETVISAKSFQILAALAVCISPEQFQQELQKIAPEDISQATRDALDAIQSYEKQLSVIKKRYPRAYVPWGTYEDGELLFYVEKRTAINEIAALLERSPGAILARIVKLEIYT